MKNIPYLAALILVLITASCKKYLNETPQGVIATSDLTSATNTDAQVIAAYSYLGNDHYFYPFSSMWAYGSIRSGDAYKGGGGPGDIFEFNEYETFALNNIQNGSTDNVWYQLYVGVARTNSALNLVNGQTLAAYPNILMQLNHRDCAIKDDEEATI